MHGVAAPKRWCGPSVEPGVNLGAVFPQAEFTRVDPDELVTFVQRLEDAGYDHLLVYDHVLGADSDAVPTGRGSTTTATRSSSR